MDQTSAKRATSVYIYIPNLIGYTRVLLNIVAFALCFSNKSLFAALYFISFMCDGLDGWFARNLNQVSTFGAVLDMVTDSTFLSGKMSHKDVKDQTSWLLRAYYQHRYFMAFCCVGSEVLYIILYLIHKNQPESLVTVSWNAAKNSVPLSILFILTLLGWAIKQIVNVIQMKTAADACVLNDHKPQKGHLIY